MVQTSEGSVRMPPSHEVSWLRNKPIIPPSLPHVWTVKGLREKYAVNYVSVARLILDIIANIILCEKGCFLL